MTPFAVAALLAVASAPAPAPKPLHLKVLVLDVNSADLTDSERTTLTNLEAAHLSEDARLEVLSGEDLRQLVKLQGQAAELGVTNGHCTDACMAELAGALGAGVVIATQAGKLGDTLVVTLAVFDANKARSVSRRSLEATSLSEVPRRIGPALDALVTPLLPGGMRHQGEAAAAPAPPPRSSSSASSPPRGTTMSTEPAGDANGSAAEDDTPWIILGVGAAVGAVLLTVLILVGPNGNDGLATKPPS